MAKLRFIAAQAVHVFVCTETGNQTLLLVDPLPNELRCCILMNGGCSVEYLPNRMKHNKLCVFLNTLTIAQKLARLGKYGP